MIYKCNYNIKSSYDTDKSEQDTTNITTQMYEDLDTCVHKFPYLLLDLKCGTICVFYFKQSISILLE